METESLLEKEVKITWYRSPVDRGTMSRLMKKSDAKGFVHAGLHLALFATTATLAYVVFQNVTATNWIWSLPLLLLAVFVHGSFTHFMGGVAMHELCHKTPFRSQTLNDLFLYVFSFLSWFDPVGYRLSHVKHHQVTVHRELDGEVILPQKLDWSALEEGEVTLPPLKDRRFAAFLLWQFLPLPNPVALWHRFTRWTTYAMGDLKGVGMFAGGEEWTKRILPEEKPELRLRHRNWARVVLFGHLLLATGFILSGHWFLLVLITCAGTYAGWLGSLCGLPQHLGMGPPLLPHLHLQPLHRFPLLEHAVSRGAPHVPRGALLQLAGAAEGDRAGPPAGASRPDRGVAPDRADPQEAAREPRLPFRAGTPARRIRRAPPRLVATAVSAVPVATSLP